MAIDQVLPPLSSWTRKHDLPGTPHIQEASKILYPKTLEDLIEICKNRAPGERLKAAGSHWALSEAAISDHTFVETHDPDEAHQAMGATLGATLRDVVPFCMNDALLDQMGQNLDPRWSLIHVEAGKRIYQLYAELDDFQHQHTLGNYMMTQYNNFEYARRAWALATLGAAGGQTIVGALTTGTHGGDFDRSPIADSVLAIHLVADGGKHYWIEGTWQDLPQITDDSKLKNHYDVEKYGTLPGGPSNFEIIRDDNVFNAVLVSVGRFGIIYSVLLRAVPQYVLHEERHLTTWQALKDPVKNYIADLGSDLYRKTSGGPLARFLQIAVCLTPHENWTKNLAGVTKRWNSDLYETSNPNPDKPCPGRKERVGKRIHEFNDQIQAPGYEAAGRSYPYKSDQSYPTFLELACTDASFLTGLARAASDDLARFVESHGNQSSNLIDAIGEGVDTEIDLAESLWMLELVSLLRMLQSLFDSPEAPDRFAQWMENVRNVLLGGASVTPATRAAGIFIWQAIAYTAFEKLQSPHKFDAISYAVMDIHDYIGTNCEVNVDSIEVFFDATDPRLVAFVDSLITYEKYQESIGKAFVGYVALRFMGPTRATIGMQRFARTCSIEVSCLKDVTGSKELLEYALTLARNPTYGGILHWGQRNDFDQNDVERIYGDRSSAPGGSLATWRSALSRITENGRLDGFSSDFTRKTGLEIVRPKIGGFLLSHGTARVGETVTVKWDYPKNPPRTSIGVEVRAPDSTLIVTKPLPVSGEHQFQVTMRGGYTVMVFATLTTVGERTLKTPVRTVLVH